MEMCNVSRVWNKLSGFSESRLPKRDRTEGIQGQGPGFKKARIEVNNDTNTEEVSATEEESSYEGIFEKWFVDNQRAAIISNCHDFPLNIQPYSEEKEEQNVVVEQYNTKDIMEEMNCIPKHVPWLKEKTVVSELDRLVHAYDKEIRAGSTVKKVKTISKQVSWVAINAGAKPKTVSVIPENVRGVVMNAGVAPQTVRVIPQHVRSVGINVGSTPKAVQAIPNHVRQVRVYGGVTPDVVRAIPMHVDTVMTDIGVTPEAVLAIPSHIQRIVLPMVLWADLAASISALSPEKEVLFVD